jgi:putative aminopeptidase FrvX
VDKRLEGIDLLEALSLALAPSGCEAEVRDLVRGQLEGQCDAMAVDGIGDLIVRVDGRSRHDKSLMFAAHMDEVGFMVQTITDDGFLTFAPLGGMDPRVLCAKRVQTRSWDGSRRSLGVIISKAIHMQTAAEKAAVTPVSDMYIDVGADSRADAERFVQVGDYGSFVSGFYRFGGGKLKGKALDDRFGCAAMIETARSLYTDRPVQDTYFAFTVREEVGLDGAAAAARYVKPAKAVILEATAVADIAGVSGYEQVGEQGKGGLLSYLDWGTVYGRDFVDFARAEAEKYGIPAQLKRYVAGGNDAAAIQRSLAGVKVLNLSAPARYIHSASCVVAESDYFAVTSLCRRLARDIDIDF